MKGLGSFFFQRASKLERLTLQFTKKNGNDIFISQNYVDDIIFGSTNEDFCKEF
jgi:hypothetical protein